MEKIKSKDSKNLFRTSFIILAWIFILFHLIELFLETKNPIHSTQFEHTIFSDSAEQTIADSIWHDTEFILE